MTPLFEIAAAATLSGFLSMLVAALVTFRLPPEWLKRMVSFSAGLLLSIALLDLLPEALGNGLSIQAMGITFAAGLLGFFVFEKSVLTAHSHGGKAVDARLRPVPLVMFGSALHIWTDGVILSAAFLAGPMLGWGMTLVVVIHEIPREGGDFALLLASGWSKRKALLWNGASRLACVAGGLMGYSMFNRVHEWIPVALTLAAAGFIYITATMLLPWIKSERGGLARHGVFMAMGAMMVPLGWVF